MGPVFRFWKLQEECSYIRFTGCHCCKAGTVLVSGDAQVKTEMVRGLLTLPPRQALWFSPCALCPSFLLVLLQRLHWSCAEGPLLMSELEAHPYG